MPAALAVPVPEGMDLTVAAAAMLQGMTAHYLSHSTYPVNQGDHVVVHAAAGGVGLLLTQMIAMRGGISIATTSTTAKAVLAQQAGANYITDYESFAAVARDVTDGAGVAAVYDGIGQSTFEASLSALRIRGYMVLYGAASGPVPPFDLQRLNPAGSLFVTRPTLGHYLASREELMWRAGDVFRWITAGPPVGPHRRPLPAGTGRPGPVGSGFPGHDRQAAAAAGRDRGMRRLRGARP